MKLTRNHLIAGLIVAVGAIVSVATGTIINAAVSPGVFHGYDCSGNSIVACGFSSPSKLRSTYNSSDELKSLYGHFGWTSADINGTNGTTMVAGVVYRNGTVVVDGKTIATNAQSVGRWQDDGTGCKATQSFTIGAHKYWQSTPQCRYGYEGEDAWVMVNAQGQFVGAINKACGNPAPATPVTPPKPKPVAVCNSLTATAITSDMVGASKLNFNFTTKATASGGATIKNYAYNFGDGTTTTTGATTSHSYKASGTYKVTVTVTFSVNGSSTSSSCATSLTAYKSTPRPPVVECTSLKLNAIARDTFSLDATASVMPGLPYQQEGGSISSYTFTVKDSEGNVVKTINVKAGLPMQNATSGTFTLQAGSYTANVIVHSNAGDKGGNGSCAVAFTVQPAPGTACNTQTHAVETVDKSKENTPPYTTDFSQCQPKTPMCTVPGKETLPANSADCVETPVATVMPTTGIGDFFGGLIGLGSITGATWYYIASRRG